jgi:hypothetical protein
VGKPSPRPTFFDGKDSHHVMARLLPGKGPPPAAVIVPARAGGGWRIKKKREREMTTAPLFHDNNFDGGQPHPIWYTNI